MIDPLRRRHRLMWWALALALPSALIVSLLVRPDQPVMESLPGELAGYATSARDD